MRVSRVDGRWKPTSTFVVGLPLSFDTTLSLGLQYRLSDPSPDLYGTSNAFSGVAGRQSSVNSDDGNLNYGKGWVSQLLKGTHDLEVRYGNFGALARGFWYQDCWSELQRCTVCA